MRPLLNFRSPKWLLSILVLPVLLFMPGLARAASITVNTTSDVVNAADGQCSLREAVIAANTNTASGIVVGECAAGVDGSSDIIYLANGATYPLTIAGSGEEGSLTGDLDVSDNVAITDITIRALSDGSATIDANGLGDRTLHLHGASIQLLDISLSGGSHPDTGGNVYVADGKLEMIDGAVMSGTANAGGGIFNDDGLVILDGTLVTLNEGTLGGGGLFSQGSSAQITLQNSATVRANTSSAGSGAGLSVEGGQVDILDGSTVNLNVAQIDGGGLAIDGGAMLTLSQANLESNEAVTGSGGALYLGDSDSVDSATISAADFSDNMAGAEGGAIYGTSTGHLDVNQSSFIQNQAGTDGGAIHTTRLRAYDTWFELNTAVDQGGAVKATIALEGVNSEFHQNEAAQGGGVESQQMVATYFVFDNNEATNGDGGAAHLWTRVDVMYSSFTSNTASEKGGAIYLNSTHSNLPANLGSSYLASNQAGTDGGGLYVGPGEVARMDIWNVTAINNTAVGNGGVVFVDDVDLTVVFSNITAQANSAGSNGSVLRTNGFANFQNSVIDGQTQGKACVADGPATVSLGNNIEAQDDCDFSATGDMQFTDAMIASPADNGGATLTMALLTGSPALNAGNDAACAAAPVGNVDQRGEWRNNGICDIGAFEQSSSLFLPIVTSP
jgi:CSLREA domain-containing protein